MPLTPTQTTLQRTLTDALHPLRLEVKDVSARHAGHSGARPEGGTHFEVVIVASQFQGLARLARHRLVYGLLEQAMREGVHALQLTTLSPSEDG